MVLLVYVGYWSCFNSLENVMASLARIIQSAQVWLYGDLGEFCWEYEGDIAE